MRKIILFILLLFSAYRADATHIIGGSMFYEHLGGSSYLVSIRLYKDCSPFSINFSTSIKVEIRAGDGTLPTPSSVRLPLLARDTLDPSIDTCAFNPGVCVELGVYSKIVNLPPQVDGYHLFYTDCCRNASVANILSPLQYGEGLHTYIPDNNVYITNSSPVFTAYPPVYVCKDQDLNFDFSATDADGDSLTYELIKPYHGKNEFDTQYAGLLPTISSTGTPPDNITFNNIIYLPNFSETNPLNPISGNGLSISSTGLLTGTPELTGQFLVAVKVDEYRNGVKIGTIVRDFQYNVLDCPPLKDAAIGDIDVCSGLSVQMINASGAGANGFWWDFGTGNPGDTSVLESPLFTYPNNGTYNVTLMAQKGTLCADTAYYEMTLSTVTAASVLPDTVCLNETVTLMSTSSTSANDSIKYVAWDFDGNALDSGLTVFHEFSAAGSFQVEMIVESYNGCSDTVTTSIFVKSPPTADFSPEISCNSQTIQFNNLSATDATGLWWNFGTGIESDSSDLLSPNFSFPTFGIYPVTLITQKGTACADTIIKNVGLFDVSADFNMPDTVCKGTSISFQDNSSAISTAIDSWEWSFGTLNTANIQHPSQTFANSGSYQIKLITNTPEGCTDTIAKQLEVVDIPNVQFQPSNLCSGPSINFTNLSNSAATSFLWAFGTGSAADTSQIAQPTFNFPSFGSFNVTLTANPNSSCSASSSLLMNVSNVAANFSVQDTVCAASTIIFSDQSTASSGLSQWHWNFDDLTTSVSQNNFHQYNQGGTYNVQLVVFASDGCSDTIVKVVEVLHEPIINGGADTAQCVSNASIDLSGFSQNSAGVIWIGNGGVISPNSDSSDITYTPNSTELNNGQTFVVFSTAMNPFCPVQTDTVFIDFIETPEVEVLADFSVCENDNFISIEGTVLNSTQTIWTANGAGTIVNQNLLNTVYNPTQSDVLSGSVEFILSSFNVYGCEDDSDTLVVSFSPLPQIDLNFTDTVCFLESVDLVSNSNTGNGYWGTIGDGFFTPSDTGATTTYHTGLIDSDLGFANLTFTTLDNGGCAPYSEMITVTILRSPQTDLGTILSCFGSPTQLVDLTEYPDPITDWTWYVEDSIYTNSAPSHLFSGSGFFDVSLAIVSENGCSDSASIPIQVHALPIADFVSPEPCIYGAVFVDSSHDDSTTIDSWLWNFGDGNSSTLQNPTHPFDSVGNYTVSLEVTSGYGCMDTVAYIIPIYPPPVSQFTFFPNPAKVNEVVTFNSTAFSVNAPIVEWDWDFANGDSSDLIDPSTSYDMGGMYNVQLIVFDAIGCRDTSEQSVFIAHGPKIPAAFSPNGDGVNDYLMILGSGFEEIDFTVYNNWGRVLYNTTDVNDKGWDGTYEGEPQPMGPYVYKARVKTVFGQIIEISGDSTIIR
ncbi:MAG: PKD domain-containing protein [Crocinitomicaceae bacterium]